MQVFFYYLTNSLKFKAGLVRGSNNYAEFMASIIPIECPLEKDVKHIQIFGDSSFVINWMKGSSLIYSCASLIYRVNNIYIELINIKYKMNHPYGVLEADATTAHTCQMAAVMHNSTLYSDGREVEVQFSAVDDELAHPDDIPGPRNRL
jgi:ribonuclease HI